MKALALALLVGGAVACSVTGCGYRALYAQPSEVRLSVVLVRARVADAVANDEVLSGVRTALAREGALAAGTGYPRMEVEVLRADEASEGIASATDATGTRVPQARATQIGVLARAWIVRAQNGSHEADTGDVRAFNVVESSGGTGLVAESMRHDDALRAAARRVGQRLALRVLGHPVARDESAEELW
ncbi:hypothetical protein LZC95_18680 [Pendulispora brunnea]|uniref:Lipoprotein n=1 Tax=Pendulispora brunnea TaxID=2905690 RepID=A0ABZ2KL92_9BACT